MTHLFSALFYYYFCFISTKLVCFQLWSVWLYISTVRFEHPQFKRNLPLYVSKNILKLNHKSKCSCVPGCGRSFMGYGRTVRYGWLSFLGFLPWPPCKAWKNQRHPWHSSLLCLNHQASSSYELSLGYVSFSSFPRPLS